MNEDIVKLKEISHICAYCGIALKPEDKTIDHIKPKRADGKAEINNVVIACSECNLKKGHIDINNFLQEPDRAKSFFNYLCHIDYQLGNTDYSEAIQNEIDRSVYSCEFLNKKKEKASEDVVCYYLLDNGQKISVNPHQMKIIDYYIENKGLIDYKIAAHELKMSRSEFRYHVIRINNLTGLFPLKEVSKNGIQLNPLFKIVEKVQANLLHDSVS